jgi:hypothetical protein
MEIHVAVVLQQNIGKIGQIFQVEYVQIKIPKQIAVNLDFSWIF